ncbi:MAG: conserved phage C-terminal domain-containing protein [Desulfobulbaceae bacterium]|nr:conserved phage C-terminal domain-containing protein [Desulfobulbaceae bacterium]
MARSRNIKPGFFKNYDLADLGPVSQLLFAGLWCLADRDGRLEDKPRLIKAELFPYYECDVNGELTKLARLKFVDRYVVDGEQYIQIENFQKHQQPHHTEKKSIIPERTLSCCNVDTPDIHGEVTVNIPLIPDSLLLIPDSLIPGEKTCPAEAEHSTPHSDIPQQESHKQRKKQPVTSGEDVSAVFSHWKSVMGHGRAQLDAKREKAIRARLKDGYTVEELCEAVDGCKASPFHQGDNKDRTKYDDIELVCREAKNVDKFRRIKADGFSGKGLSIAGMRTAAAAQRFIEKMGAQE